ncbi:nitrite reductase small subunit NirD [Glaciecola siphonariae]|uniref:Nitrite reductase small subunit NirD n=1 Tax=Glaciecola siphonariae TaxID=521012 RepID=A0ABV9LUC1_9ALTE
MQSTMTSAVNKQASQWHKVCHLSELVINSGVCALVQGQQIALFALKTAKTEAPSVYALSNFDPIGLANVMSRGIIGSIQGEPVIASPLYKQHYSLLSGKCLEQSEYALEVYDTHIIDEWLHVSLKC